MKNLITLLVLFVALSCKAQDSEYLKLWNKYVDECEVIVQDTITEYGMINYKLVISDGPIILTPIDTTWSTIERKEYKDSNYGNLYIGSYQGFNLGSATPATYTLTASGTLDERIVWKSDNTISTAISRIIVYNLKAKRPDRDDFWEWLKLNNYRK